MLLRAEQATAWFDHAAVVTQVRYSAAQDTYPPTHSEIQVRQYFGPHGEMRVKMEISQHAPTGKRKTPVEREYIVAGDRHVLFFPSLVPPKVLLSRTERDIEKWKEIIRCDPMAGCFLVGRFVGGDLGNVSIFELARRGHPRVLATRGNVNDVPCEIVESDAPVGVVRIWIAPSLEYNFVKFEFEQNGAAGKVSKDFKASFEFTDKANRGGRTILLAGRYHSSFVPMQGSGFQSLTEDVEARRTDVDSSPTYTDPNLFSFADVPNGAMVTFDDDRASTVQYIWRDGKAVPLVDSGLLEWIRGQAQTGRASSSSRPAGTPVEPSAAVAAPIASTPGTEYGLWRIGVGACLVLLFVTVLWIWKRSHAFR
jgi:hypothetical protein